MSVLDPESRELFRAARAEITPSDESRERVRTRLAAQISAGAIGAAIATTSTQAGAVTGNAAGGITSMSASKTLAMALVSKLAVPVIIGSVTTVAAVRAYRTPTAAIATAMTVALPDFPIARAPVVRALPRSHSSETPVARDDASPLKIANAPSVGTPKHGNDTLTDEVQLVDEMEKSLRAGDPAKAARLSNEHERRFPNGTLTEEREGARVLSSCLSGARAASGASAFLGTHPKSPLRERILAACKEH